MTKTQQKKLNEQEIKKEYATIQNLYKFTFWNFIMVLISIADYICFAIVQNDFYNLNLTYVIAGISFIQVVDYVVMVHKNNKCNISYVDVNFVLYTVVIISIVICVVCSCLAYFDTMFTAKQAQLFKFSASVFHRGLITTVRQTEKQKSVIQKISSKQAFTLYLRDFITQVVLSFYKLLCFILFFAGMFMYTTGFDTLSIFYFLIVTLSTVGYGDITFSGIYGRLIMITFIISAIIFVPAEVTLIVKNIRVVTHNLKVKRNIANGVVIIGKFDKGVAEFMRSRTPIKLAIVYIVVESGATQNFKDEASNIIFYQMKQFDIEKFVEWNIHQAQQIIIFSKDYVEEGDQETINYAQQIISITSNIVELKLVFNTVQYHKIALNIFHESTNCRLYCFYDYFGLIVSTSINNFGFSTLLLNLLGNFDDSAHPLYNWYLYDQENTNTRQYYQSSLQYKLGLTTAPYQRNIGGNYTVSSHQSHPQGVEPDSEILSELSQQQIHSVGIIALRGTPEIFLRSIIQFLKQQVFVFQEELLIESQQNVTVQMFQMDKIEHLMSLKTVDVIVCILPPGEQKQSNSFFIQQYLKEFNQSIVISELYPVDFQEAELNLKFRTGQFIPLLKAQYLASLCNNANQIELSQKYMLDIFHNQIQLRLFKANCNVQIEQISNRNKILYINYNNTIVAFPENILLTKNDYICLTSAKQVSQDLNGD
ncbi:Ion_transport 2 and transmembrane domain-containing protein [Hexamita inflata]|uniref:Ion transport 2 and transmembrane domain-containing protein n=1 Tax=Hexamita inflata TaxID=28002 RepID=A0AA86TNW6_9EUKA|nr:Ion transport 2 and transmembrane domain-containing protein [Hexamita inflata]